MQSLREYVQRVSNRIPRHPRILTRIVLLLVGVVAILLLSRHITGQFIPSDSTESLLFQGGLLLVVFGSLVFEDKFTKPSDGVVNALLVLISLIPSFANETSLGSVLISGYAGVVLISGVLCFALSGIETLGVWANRLNDRSHKIATGLGQSNLMFSAVFFYAILSLKDLSINHGMILTCFWGVVIVLWPLRIPHLIEAIFSTTASPQVKGTVVRVEVPNILRVKLATQATWSGDLLAALGDGTCRRVLPLYTQIQGEDVIGTGLISEVVKNPGIRTNSGAVYLVESETHDTEETTEPIGIVCEGSRIDTIRFETWKHEMLREGLLVYFQLSDETIYYQVSDAQTKQEVFEGNRHGFQVVEAHQLGTFHGREGFKKYFWLPEVNTPIFVAENSIQGNELAFDGSEMALGTIPGTDVTVLCDIDGVISHHSAILGVTGSGKTELAFRVIQRAIENNVKVFCVDITDQYSEQLKHLNPTELSISTDLAEELGQKLHEAETGEYGAGKEKKVLKEFTDRLRKDIDCRVSSFVTGPDSLLGIFSLPSISNTKATLQATEIYLTSLFKYNRMNAEQRRRVLVVLEEAHTVVPETGTMGLGDFDSKGMVAKIAQIALQGRKYDVGLLVIAQRTATVSKTVLTQCNTMISFSSFDKTGLDFLSNVYGAKHTSKISNLLPFHALAFGKGINSERPVIVEMPPLEQVDKTPDESPVTS